MIKFDVELLTAAEAAELIRYHNARYWQDGEAEISDALYDQVVERLRTLEPEHPLLNEIHTPAVAASGKVIHSSPMLSLDKAYSLEAILEWAEKYARSPEELLLVEPKYDGISVSFDGRTLATRGDGAAGEDVTDKLPLIELEAPGYTGRLDRPARGELLIRKDDFKEIYSRIRKKDGGTYKNSRNAVAGIMGLKDISDMLAQGAKLTLADYRLISYQVPLNELAAKWEKLKEELAVLPYPQDGIVIKFADREYSRSLGNTAHHPRGEIAYKFTNLRAETRLIGVEWSFGKNCLTPVAQLEPVELSGITIKRASLHNAQTLIDMDVMIGDTVVVERAGDVIPYIAECRPGSERRDPMISHCPSCDTLLERRGPELVCPCADCPETRHRRLLAAVRSLGIERLGEPTLRKLINSFGIRHLTGLFKLTVADLLGLEGFQERSAENLINEISRGRRVEDYRLLASLNIPHIGLNMARQLLADHPLDELRRFTEEEFAVLPGIGPERAKALVSEFEMQKDYLDELLAAVELVPSSGGGAALRESRPTVCFTGKMPEKRSWYSRFAADHGYEAVDSVTRELSLLVAADPTAGGSKLTNARKYGIRIVSLEEFMQMAGAAGAGLSGTAAADPAKEAPADASAAETAASRPSVPEASVLETAELETGDLFAFAAAPPAPEKKPAAEDDGDMETPELPW